MPVTVQFSGEALGADGSSTINLNPDYNLVGLPLDNPSINYVSDLFALDGIGGNVPVIIFTDNGDFKAVGPTGGPNDIPITGGQVFMLDVQRGEIINIIGDGWNNIEASQ